MLIEAPELVTSMSPARPRPIDSKPLPVPLMMPNAPAVGDFGMAAVGGLPDGFGFPAAAVELLVTFRLVVGLLRLNSSAPTIWLLAPLFVVPFMLMPMGLPVPLARLAMSLV